MKGDSWEQAQAYTPCTLKHVHLHTQANMTTHQHAPQHTHENREKELYWRSDRKKQAFKC